MSNRRYDSEKRVWYWFAGVVMLIIPFIFIPFNHTRQWIPLGVFGMSIQPNELTKIIIIIILADMLKDKNLKHPIISSCVVTLTFIVLIFLQNDLGAVLMHAAIAFILILIAYPKLSTLAVGGTAAFGGWKFFYWISGNLRARVKVMNNPQDSFEGLGYQLSQSFMSIANGGSVGKGISLGRGARTPLFSTDFVFSIICEEFGLIFGLVLLLVYLLLALHILGIARRAKTRYHAMIAAACGFIIGFQTFVIVGGVICMIPLTGITLPFISAGGTSMITLMALVGIAGGIDMIDSDLSRHSYSSEYYADL